MKRERQHASQTTNAEIATQLSGIKKAADSDAIEPHLRKKWRSGEKSQVCFFHSLFTLLENEVFDAWYLQQQLELSQKPNN